MKLAVEMSRLDERRYGHVHKAGCRDLRDPESMGEAATYDQARAAFEDMTGWDDDPYFAPCVKLEGKK
jgi:hypothetical protein